MIKHTDIRVHTGRCVGGTFIRVEHVPTGICREQGPIGNTDKKSLMKQWLTDIEAELREKGLSESIAEET